MHCIRITANKKPKKKSKQNYRSRSTPTINTEAQSEWQVLISAVSRPPCLREKPAQIFFDLPVVFVQTSRHDRTHVLLCLFHCKKWYRREDLNLSFVTVKKCCVMNRIQQKLKCYMIQRLGFPYKKNFANLTKLSHSVSFHPFS